MAKCNNCALNAVYAVHYSASKDQLFCEKHLPWTINKHSINGNGNVTRLDVAPVKEEEVAKPTEPVEPTIKKSVKKSVPTPPVEEVVEAVEEPPLADLVEEFPTE